jgi:hypothetical protein
MDGPHGALKGQELIKSAPNADIEVMRNEVLRKIGRNLLLFQQMEGMLKFLIANGAIAGYASDLPAVQKRRAEAISKRTMGQLVGEFLETHLGEEADKQDGPEELREIWISFRFRVETDAAYVEERRAALADIVAERNDLIHHFLPRWDPQSVESTQEADRYLECQREKALVELEVLRGMVKALEDGRRTFGEFVASGEWKRQFHLEGLRQSRLVILLGDIAQQIGRDDGCVLLNTAGELLRQHAPEEFALMAQRLGHKTLKSLILATEIFDIVEEPTKKGGVRVMYRLKPGWSLHFGDAPEG